MKHTFDLLTENVIELAGVKKKWNRKLRQRIRMRKKLLQ